MTNNTDGVDVRGAMPSVFWEWVDRQSRHLFIMPAVIMILVFSIFPLIASAILALSRMRLRAGGYQIRFVGFANFKKQILGSEQFHFLGTFGSFSLLAWAFTIGVAALLLWWLLRYLRGPVWWLGLIGRLITGVGAECAQGDGGSSGWAPGGGSHLGSVDSVGLKCYSRRLQYLPLRWSDLRKSVGFP